MQIAQSSLVDQTVMLRPEKQCIPYQFRAEHVYYLSDDSIRHGTVGSPIYGKVMEKAPGG